MSSRTITVGSRVIGGDAPCFIVAELGINHNGNLDICKKMVRSAKECGADAVKLQLVRPKLVSSDPWFIEAHQRAKFTYEECLEVKRFAQSTSIGIFSSIGDVESFKMFKRLGFNIVKISSSNLNNLPLHEMVVKLRLPVIISTGDAFLPEIARVVDFYKSSGIDLALTHCISHYPTKPEETFLKAIPYLKDVFGVTVGFSDHTEGILTSVTAIALGAQIIEKHFTLDKKMEGPDHKFSLNPEEFSLLVSQIRETESTLASPRDYFPQTLVRKESAIRRAIVFTHDKSAGYVVKGKDIFIGRPKYHCDNEIDPFDYRKVTGKRLIKDIGPFEPLTYEHI
ncbi:N-acetylneuraminate synthase family protein [Chloroflexota bacterium]